MKIKMMGGSRPPIRKRFLDEQGDKAELNNNVYLPFFKGPLK